MKHTKILTIAAVVTPLYACGAGESAEGLTAAEERELDEAAAQLDASQADLDALPQEPVEQPSEEQGEP